MWTIEDSPLGRIVVPPYVPEGFAVFCTTRDFDGFLKGDAVGRIARTLRERFSVEAVLTTCTQVHGTNVTRANASKQWRECDSCDALWSVGTGVSLGIKVADCLPIVMVDPLHSVIADVHSGWRGAAAGITAATLDALARETAFDAGASFAYLGPAIRVCCFEVGEEVAARFDPRYVDRSHAKPHVDIAAFTAAVLRARGFADERIVDSGLCTRCEGSIFHSYRRDGTGGGRNLSIVAH